jgi:exopolysaccharide production protein ExoQ
MSLVIPRDRILDPAANAVFAVPAIALSLFVFAYSTLFGQISILAFYGLWMPILFLLPALLTQNLRPVIFVLMLPALAALSVLWSDVPAATLRASIQYGTTVLCGLIAARVVSVRSLVTGGVLGGVVILLYSHAEGKYGYDYVDASWALQGAFSSKNQLGFYASLTVLLALAMATMARRAFLVRLVAVGIAGFAAWTLVLSDSATSVIALLAALMAALIVLGVMWVQVPARAQSIVILLCIAGALAAFAVQIGALDTVFVVFGKDPTLTGRTFLWNQGILFGEQRPVLGLGYYAFWVHNRPEAEELWREFYITARTGFHFHNTLIEGFVALGIVGASMMAAWMLVLLGNALRMVMNPGRERTEAALCAALGLMFFIRAGVEIDFFTPYTAGSFLVPYLLVRVSDRRRAVIAQLPARAVAV